MQKIVLATSVCSRSALLQRLGVDFWELNSNIVEQEIPMDNAYSPYEWVQAISQSKARAVLDRVAPGSIIVGADTIIVDTGKILHRPRNKEEAVSMLLALQGKKHTAYTGLTLLYVHADGTYHEEVYVDSADVTMLPLDQDQLTAYAETDEPYDKAGGYDILGKGATLVDGVCGDFYTVAGLPIRLLYKSLKENGIDLIRLSEQDLVCS